ncbi:TIGR01777 family oxidoreductase [soil metagenome]
MAVVLITGGTGLIGANLTRHLTAKKHEVIILSRDRSGKSEKPLVEYAHWNIDKQEIEENALLKADYIIHLAGAGVMDKRWTKSYKEEILKSRTESSKLLVKSLQKLNHHVSGFISASAIGYYGADPKTMKDGGFIESDPPDNSFLGDTCVKWENSVEPVVQLGIRLCKLRTGIVLANNGGAYAEFKRPVNFGIAAILSTGKQVVSWIHIDDLCRMYLHCIFNTAMEGAYNAVGPAPVTNKKLTLEIADAIRKKFYIPVHIPQFVLKLMLGQQSIEILKSATVSSTKIYSVGFTFLYPTIEMAIAELTEKN